MLKKNFGEIYDAYHLNGKYNTFVKPHLDSYNKFVSEDIENIIKRTNPISVEEKVDGKTIRGILEFTNIKFILPQCTTPDNEVVPIYPNECRLNNKTYAFTVHLDYKFSIYERAENGPEKMKIMVDSEKTGPLALCKIPVMVKSKMCSLYGLNSDQMEILHEDRDEFGQYFIVGGVEYIIVTQENKAENFIFKNIETKDKKKEYSVWIQSKKSGEYNYPFYTMVAINLVDEAPIVKIAITISKKKGVYLPMKVVFMALGIINDRDIHDIICDGEDSSVQDIIKSILETPIYNSENQPILTKKDAILHITSVYKKINTYYTFNSNNEDDVIKNMIYELCERQLLPHIGGQNELKKKTLFLGQMVKWCVRLYLEMDLPIDRDNYGNKRVLGPGIMLSQLFKYNMDMLISDFKKNIKSELSKFSQEKDYTMIIINNFKEKKIDMSKNIATGKWPAGFTKKEKDGVSQLREIKSSMDVLAYTCKVVTPVLDANSTSAELRAVHQSTFGFLDPADSPDGGNIGLIKHTTHMAIVSENYGIDAICVEIEKNSHVLNIDNLVVGEIADYLQIYVNGIWKYCIPFAHAKKLEIDLIDARRSGSIHRLISIIRDYENGMFRIVTDAGRLLRPLLIVDNNKLRITTDHFKRLKEKNMTFDDLLLERIIEYTDIHETEKNCLIARTEGDLQKIYNYTHCDIDETVNLSINTLHTVWANYNQGARQNFQNGMRKQAVCYPMSNYRYRPDKSVLVFTTAELPNVSAIGEKYSQLAKHPHGVNVRIVVKTADGYNVDDATVINKDTMQSNGIMSVFAYKTYTDKLYGSDEEFMKPEFGKCEKFKKPITYAYLESSGMPKIGAKVEYGDVIVGHVQLISKTDREKKRGKYEYVDRSMIYEESMPGVVEEYFINDNEDGIRTIKVKLRIHKIIQRGDKMASTASQKGIVSMMMSREDMPYDEKGNAPDILFNPHGIITRMTMSHLYEVVGSLLVLQTGVRLDATPFCEMLLEDLVSELVKNGLSEDGEVAMFDGLTGDRLKCKVYSGFIYYQRLKHMVNDKMFARATGQIMPKTKQPIHGRKKGGGVRYGNMERDATTAHGASMVVKEFLFDKSDKFEECVSGINGMFCTGNMDSGKFEDKANQGSLDIFRTKIPWASKMLIEYIAALGIGVQMIPESDKF